MNKVPGVRHDSFTISRQVTHMYGNIMLVNYPIFRYDVWISGAYQIVVIAVLKYVLANYAASLELINVWGEKKAFCPMALVIRFAES